ncbi:MAG: hypothetical protein EA376_07205 [Phycisphaeraceae bacterium]|nr:MAG: hypothetical protein EA376_07205 [Phycisphaeraceae bacterium]
MPTWAYTTFRERTTRTGADASRVYRTLASQPSWVVKTAVTLAAVALLAMALILIIPAMIIFIVVILIGTAVERVKRLFRGGARPAITRRNDGEGRRNVRVIPGQSHG